jgi:hypothetical protein
MSNITLELDNDRFISFHQDDTSGRVEILPIWYKDNEWIGEPVTVNSVADLVDILIGCQNDDFAVFENQFEFEFETVANDDWPMDRSDD